MGLDRNLAKCRSIGAELLLHEEEDAVEELSLAAMLGQIMLDKATRLLHGWAAVSTNIWDVSAQTPCQLTGEDPASPSSDFACPCMRVLVEEPEIDWHASMRAVESLAIPFEQTVHCDCAMHRGVQTYGASLCKYCINSSHSSSAWDAADK